MPTNPTPEEKPSFSTITLHGKQLKLKFDAAAYYRFSKEGGDLEEIKSALDDSRLGLAKAFANIVLLAWAMLKAESASAYRTPEALAGLFFPKQDEAGMLQLAEIVKSDLAVFQPTAAPDDTDNNNQ